MRIKRRKVLRKTLEFYRLHFSLLPPYTCLCDSSFLTHALEEHIQLTDQVQSLLGYKSQTKITQCTHNLLKEWQSKNSFYKGAWMIASNLHVVACGCKNANEVKKGKNERRRDREGQEWSTCSLIDDETKSLDSLIRRKFIFCTVSERNKKSLRQRSLPVMVLQGQVPIMEEPSRETLTKVKSKESSNRNVQEWEKKALGLQQPPPKEALAKTTKKSTGKKQPNPLSVKKKVKKIEISKPQVPAENTEKSRKRRRKKKTSDSIVTQQVHSP
jgi:rRNA-processing protein FCF1